MSLESRVDVFVPSAIAPRAVAPSEAAHAAGFAAGWAAGARAAAEAAELESERVREDDARRQRERDAQTARTIAALDAAVRDWRARATPVLAEAESSVHTAALRLAEAVLQREVRPGPESARVLLERALALPPEMPPVLLRLHPDDHAQVTALIDSGAAALPDGLTLVADPRLAHGDAITEHADGALDARIDGALARARAVLGGFE